MPPAAGGVSIGASTDASGLYGNSVSRRRAARAAGRSAGRHRGLGSGSGDT